MLGNRITIAGALLTLSAAAQSVYPTGTTIWDQSRTDDGFTMFEAPTGEIMLIDMFGRVINRWRSPIAGEMLVTASPLRNGHILAASKTPSQRGSQRIFELDWSGDVVWSYTLPASLGFQHHDVRRLRNGNTMLLCAVRTTVPAISPQPIADDFLLEVDPAGQTVWTWYTSAHFAEFGFSAQSQQLIASLGGDWAHTNSVSELPANQHSDPALRRGNLLLSHRNTNIIFIVDKQTGVVVWKIGPDNNQTFGQHAPLMLPPDLPGAGRILVFDNGAGGGFPMNTPFSPSFSRVIEIDANLKQTAWAYDAANSGRFSMLFYSAVMGNARRLPNGNTLINSAVRGRLFEIDSNGVIVWEYMSPFEAAIGVANGRVGPAIYRAFRLPYSWQPFVPGK